MLPAWSNPIAKLSRMRVCDRMRTDIVTVKAGESCQGALRVMNVLKISHLPVLEGDRLVGIVTERDIYRRAPRVTLSSAALGESGTLLSHVSIGGLMTYKPVTVDPATSVKDAVRIMRERMIGSLLVVEDGRVAGILTDGDVLRILAEDLGSSGRELGQREGE